MTQKRCHPPYTTLKRTLAAMGLTYKDVADVIGVTPSTVQLKINGQSDFYISEQMEICEAFGIEAGIFFADLVA